MKRCWCGLFVHQDVTDPDSLPQMSPKELALSERFVQAIRADDIAPGGMKAVELHVARSSSATAEEPSTRLRGDVDT